MWGRYFKGQSGQGGRPCGECCTGVAICAPREVAIGEASITGWEFRLTNPADLNGPDPFDPDAKWYGSIGVSLTHTGKVYGWTFEKPHTRTFSIDMSAFGDNVYYFSDPVSVNFGPSDRTGFFSNVDGEISPGSPAAIAFEAAFGKDPFAVSLTVFPIDSIIPDLSGTVVSDIFSDDFEVGHTPPPTIDEIKAGIWMTLTWMVDRQADNWGTIYNASGFISLTQVFTEQPRGYTFLTNGLGPLDDPIHHFQVNLESSFGVFEPYTFGGACYTHRPNAFYGPLSVTLSGGVMDPAFDDFRETVMNGLNDTYTCEFASTDGLLFIGRGSHWIIYLYPLTDGLEGELISFPVADGEDSAESLQLLSLVWRLQHTGHLESFIPGGLLSQVNPGVTYNQLASLAGTTNTIENRFGVDHVVVYVSDPAQYILAVDAVSNWPNFQSPSAQFNMENFDVSIGSP